MNPLNSRVLREIRSKQAERASSWVSVCPSANPLRPRWEDAFLAVFLATFIAEATAE